MLAVLVGLLLLFALNYFFPEWRSLFEVVRPVDGTLYVSFIDVGQGDSIFLSYNDETMLIDAGEREYGSVVSDYIRERGFSQIDVVVATHPHSDHIGGMAEVIRNFDVGRVLMPDAQANTQVFENMLDAVGDKNIFAETPEPGDSFMFGDAEVTVLAPFEKSEDNLNNDSIVLKVTCGGKVFMLTGDAETVVEGQILHAGFDVRAVVLKVGHHGSSSSTGDKFFQAVSPEIAVISLGADNSYGHPHREILSKLNDAGIDIYRTDLNGTVIISTDGVNLNIETDKR
jgi:competence protein ComEC